ncbi:hypothetical protein Selin_2319 [Desulfurispirillum indicum S5]|uniref:Uncharacterized protein n=1 Tax=Desulfurispirillum indicum (strain ATCC BAA-1389 / DSM 22839 / S5) TaxID=653733 RepID=E6W471_DESIS|nr:hypothetical protein Selin_2319 [Desulfurispirillum indicum S5]
MDIVLFDRAKRTQKRAPRTPVFPAPLLACSGDPAAGCSKRPICCVAGHRSSLRRTGSTPPSCFARALHLGLFALPDPCLPAVLPDHSLPVSVPFGSCQPGVALTGRAQGGTACFCLSPVCWPSQDAPTGTLWTRRVAATTAATANQKPWRAVVCGPQFQASGRLKRTALGAAFAPLFAGKKWQKKLINRVRAMPSDTVCAELFPPFQHGIRVDPDTQLFRGCES